MTPSVQCRGTGCGRAIAFIVTRAGQHMPVDPELVTRTLLPRAEVSGAAGPREMLVTAAGTIVSGYAVDVPPGPLSVTGYVPHWGTCPARAQFKR